MIQFNINTVIEDYKLDTDELAEILFPGVKYPKKALARVLKEEASLSVGQLEKLASYIGVLPYKLFRINSWDSSEEDDCLCFVKGPFKVKLGFNSTFLTLYKNGEPVAEFVADARWMTLQEFTRYIDNLISKLPNIK